MFAFTSHGISDTNRLGTALAATLPAGATVALSGTLGAGKTQLARAIAAACEIDPEDVTSPTFVLCREYHGARSIYHFDAYRLRDTDEFMELGPEEYFASDGLVLIEWAERVEDVLPDDRVEIEIRVLDETTREITVGGIGSLAPAVDDCRRALL